MCVPLVAAAAITSVALSAGGAIMQGEAQSAALNYQAQVQRNNATIAAAQAADAQAAGDKDASDNMLRTSQRIGTQRAQAAGSGLDPNSGSPLDIQASTAAIGKEDDLTIRSNTARRVYGYQVQGMSDTAQAQLDASGAQNAEISGFINGTSSLLGGASSVAGKWDAFKTAGGTP